MQETQVIDWGVASEKFDEIKKSVDAKDLTIESEAQTRHDIIDRIIREVLGWKYGQIAVEEYDQGEKKGFVDYILKRFRVECSGDGVSTMLKPSADICQRDFGVSTLQRVL